ncbi:uncharacterized protein LOC116264069 [Nymphaea colorata]|nr:uncharacterized protein LOC116264069 [Nymphaea colorata]
MEDYRSRSYADGRMEIEVYDRSYPSGMHDMRSYSASYAPQPYPREVKAKKMKNQGGGASSGSWGFNDPEFQRKTRVASYKMYSVEGKVKGSFRKSFRWLKDRYTRIVYGWW